jgi:hypothetical protein
MCRSGVVEEHEEAITTRSSDRKERAGKEKGERRSGGAWPTISTPMDNDPSLSWTKTIGYQAKSDTSFGQ